ncbi:hypothetical protein H6P81_017512 [Aristolochia fimbriata]|uniref:Uncharacterized protein n=1 Tax=Aristolochia fimbriata TaxID=158543 RepID=A0AAV7DZ61_ARIFI|nr:hypothetical protein H6P81_017512 [Aristolochia fimbriata]
MANYLSIVFSACFVLVAVTHVCEARELILHQGRLLNNIVAGQASGMASIWGGDSGIEKEKYQGGTELRVVKWAAQTTRIGNSPGTLSRTVRRDGRVSTKTLLFLIKLSPCEFRLERRHIYIQVTDRMKPPDNKNLPCCFYLYFVWNDEVRFLFEPRCLDWHAPWVLVVPTIGSILSKPNCISIVPRRRKRRPPPQPPQPLPTLLQAGNRHRNLVAAVDHHSANGGVRDFGGDIAELALLVAAAVSNGDVEGENHELGGAGGAALRPGVEGGEAEIGVPGGAPGFVNESASWTVNEAVHEGRKMRKTTVIEKKKEKKTLVWVKEAARH